MYFLQIEKKENAFLEIIHKSLQKCLKLLILLSFVYIMVGFYAIPTTEYIL